MGISIDACTAATILAVVIIIAVAADNMWRNWLIAKRDKKPPEKFTSLDD